MKYLKEQFSSTKYGDDTNAKKARNQKAKQLRLEGYSVECKKFDFQDLARAIVYTLEATKAGD
jgi:hypothetical protein